MQNARRVFGMVIVLLGAASLTWAQNPVPIFGSAASPQIAGADFDVEIKVGNSTNPVSNLFGLSLELNYTNTSFVDVVGPPVQGDFLSSDILFFPNVDDANGKVSVGMTRKGGGGVNGEGTVLKVKFRTLATTPGGTQIQFTIANVSANDPNGAPIVLTPAPFTVVIGAVVVCPTASAINPAIGPAGTAVTITGTDLNDVTAVRFANNVAANFTITNATQISATVPNGAVTGPITLSKTGCADVQTSAFTVVACPTVSGIDPATGLAGATVTITGTNLNDVTAVKFANNLLANFGVTNATQILTTVPVGAVTGPITLSKTGCAEVQTSNFTVLPPRFVRVKSATASLGNIVMVFIELDALGDENALGFSLVFDPAIFSNPQAALGRDAGTASLITNASQTGSGRYGLVIALPAGQKFAAGTREIVVVSFAVSATTQATTTAIGFGDQPIPREAVDTGAGSLPVTWTAGLITLIAGHEGDVAPRPNGNNGAVTIEDWVQLGRFAARLDTPGTEPNEFQRADCAPKACGDGRLGI
ncbi:MAG: IPT/TIG domain-containing protein, partial [bacterium]